MELIKRRVWEAALAQLALDYNAQPQDFLAPGVTVTAAKALPGRRQYQQGAPFFQMATTGRGAVITAQESLRGPLRAWAQGVEAGHWLLEYPRLRQVEDLLMPQGWKLRGTHHMYLPAREFSSHLPQGFSYRWYDRESLKIFYPNHAWPNALLEEENPLRPDVIALGAFCRGELVALAGASADGETLWQVGIDVLPDYRSRGLGTALVEALCQRIVKLGKLPFYGTAAANTHSQSIAVKCGFFPAWVEVSSQPAETP